MLLAFDMNNPGDFAEDSLDAIGNDIGYVQDALVAIEMMASTFVDRRHMNALATMAYALSSTLDAIAERVTKIDQRDRGDVPALRALIAERDMIYRAFIAPDSAETSDEETERLVALYDAANDAWLSAPVVSVAEVREKAAYAVSRPEVIDRLRENHGELEMLLQSIVGAS